MVDTINHCADAVHLSTHRRGALPGRSVTMTTLWFTIAFAVAFTTTVAEVPVRYDYMVGATIRLQPQNRLTEKLYSVVWKYDKNLLAEWAVDQIPLTYYSKFSRRTTLDVETGFVTFVNATLADTHVYTVEINNKVESPVQRVVISAAVPPPTLTISPELCNATLYTTYNLTCEGDVSTAGTVWYWWRTDDNPPYSTKNENTLSVNMRAVRTVSCAMINAHSYAESDGVENPCYQEDTGPRVPFTRETFAVVIGSAMLLVVLAAVCLCCPRKNKHKYAAA